MEKIRSQLNTSDKVFIDRSEKYKSLIKELRQKLKNVVDRDEHQGVKQYKAKGRLLARERIDLLVDANTHFLELSPLAATGQYNDDFPSAGIITGIGYIHGREVVLVANDATVKGGTYIAETIRKHLCAQEIAMQNHLPCVYMVDSGGIFLPEQASVFPDRDDFGRIFYNQARLSAEKIPQIAVVMGSCTAGGAYIPAMCDETIIVRNQGTVFLGGPPLVKAATGETVTAEELGGGWVHTTQSGVADHLAENEHQALKICRDIINLLPRPERQVLNILPAADPVYSPEELYGILPHSPREVVDAYEVIARLVDRSEFHDFKKNYGKTLVTGFAHIKGFPVGIIASNGILYSESALKATHFIELCNFRKIPMFFLQNISGFMVGKKYENEGIARDGAKMVHAVATSNVPKFTLIFGGSYGAGNYAMAGRAYNPNLLFMYPNARIAVMGGEQAANVLATVKKDQSEKKGLSVSESELQKIKEPILKKYELESSPYYSTSRLWDDGIIDPVDTRRIIALGISASLNHVFKEPKTGIFRM